MNGQRDGLYKYLNLIFTILVLFFFSLSINSCDNKISNKKHNVKAAGIKAMDTVPQYECTTVVGNNDNINNFVNKNMEAGSIVCLAPGVYRDFNLLFGGEGLEDSPIVVKSQIPGTVTIAGYSTVRMTGTYVVLQGFVFQNGTSGSKSLIATSGNKVVCRYCRITENSVINWDSSSREKNAWIYDNGQHNRIDHNWFTGKPNRGAIILINRKDGEPDYTHIDYNYFANRAPLSNKTYPGVTDTDLEVIRLGSSSHHNTNSFSNISYNLFENIRSEAEIVSIKSSKNIFHGNTIRRSYGSISNRHGSNNVYSNNFIFGDGYPFSGGFRIADSGHIIVNNYIDQVTYPGTSHQGAIVLLGGEDESKYEPGFNGYKRVQDVVVAHNTIVNSVSSLVLFGGSKKVVPQRVTIVNNLVFNAVGPVLTYLSKGIPQDSVFSNNLVFGGVLADDLGIDMLTGFIYQDPKLVENTGVFRPSSNSPALRKAQTLNSELSHQILDLLKVDMDGDLRGSNPDIGADQVVSSKSSNIYPLTSAMVGPKSYSNSSL